MKTARGPRTRGLNHSSLTDTASRAFRALALAGVEAQPGVINPRPSRGGPRLVVTPEPRRIRIGVAGEGHQELLVYGAVRRDALLEPLASEFGADAISVRDPHGIWAVALPAAPGVG